MAMDGTLLGDEIYQRLVDAGYISDDTGDAQAIWQEVGIAIVQHIKANDSHTHTDSQGGTTSPPAY